MANDVESESIAAWAQLLRVSRTLQEQAEADLKKAGLPQLVWYDVLHELAQAGADGLRPAELTERMLLAQYNTSRLLARMDADGLIIREKCKSDGRGQIVRITTAGRKMRRRMWRVYERSIATCFASRLTGRQTRKLRKLLSRLKD